MVLEDVSIARAELYHSGTVIAFPNLKHKWFVNILW